MYRLIMAKILQIKQNYFIVVEDILFQLVQEEKADIAIISEEYHHLT